MEIQEEGFHKTGLRDEILESIIISTIYPDDSSSSDDDDDDDDE